jgi:hypothetical protein
MNNSDLIDKTILILKEAFENRQLLLAQIDNEIINNALKIFNKTLLSQVLVKP